MNSVGVRRLSTASRRGEPIPTNAGRAAGGAPRIAGRRYRPVPSRRAGGGSMAGGPGGQALAEYALVLATAFIGLAGLLRWSLAAYVGPSDGWAQALFSVLLRWSFLSLDPQHLWAVVSYY